MRERRVFITLGIVLAVFVLGIAYAAVSTQLEIKGNATGTFDPSNFQVIFSGVTGVTGTKGVNTSGSTATIDSVDKTKGTFSFNGFTTKGQTQSATWTISNDNNAELYAHIAMNTDTEINKEHFRATCELADDVLAPNETTTVTVTVECIKTPEGNVESGEMKFGFTATSSHTANPGNSGETGDPNVELLSFEVEGKTYYAPTTYTWQQFVEDEQYNTSGWVIHNGYIYESEEAYLQNDLVFLYCNEEFGLAGTESVVLAGERISDTLDPADRWWEDSTMRLNFDEYFNTDI